MAWNQGGFEKLLTEAMAVKYNPYFLFFAYPFWSFSWVKGNETEIQCCWDADLSPKI